MTRGPAYGAQHKAIRKQLQTQLNRGAIYQCSCTRLDCPGHIGQCPTLIDRFAQWDLGHSDDGLATKALSALDATDQQELEQCWPASIRRDGQ